ncbi:hypothetical protein [Streptococcus downei]|uniref:hypothetical protein n=1 Tax=Streptococcus downei TaxID=1317 RepID=UPI0013E38E10|nr:hypothetical protein [Streptococcus downei]
MLANFILELSALQKEEVFNKKSKNPCQALAFLLLYYGAVKYSLSYDTRGCDTLGCIATQQPVGFLEELAYYRK